MTPDRPTDADATLGSYQRLLLAAMDRPHYGSPRGKPIVPGARTAAINKLFKLERQNVKKLQAQGCDTAHVIPRDIR